MIDLSNVPEQIKFSPDGKIATRYRVTEESIDVDSLKEEKAGIEARLNAPLPSDKKLLEWAKANWNLSNHDGLEMRLADINKILEAL